MEPTSSTEMPNEETMILFSSLPEESQIVFASSFKSVNEMHAFSIHRVLYFSEEVCGLYGKIIFTESSTGLYVAKTLRDKNLMNILMSSKVEGIILDDPFNDMKNINLL